MTRKIYTPKLLNFSPYLSFYRIHDTAHPHIGYIIGKVEFKNLLTVIFYFIQKKEFFTTSGYGNIVLIL